VLPLERMRRQAAVGPPSILGEMKVRELIGALQDDGWVLARTRGSHRQFHHPEKSGTVTVSGHLGTDIPIGTLRSALKQAGLLPSKE
jgi:predicted RNA binding protein YcfA (HicA-like mRNA interferase family)